MQNELFLYIAGLAKNVSHVLVKTLSLKKGARSRQQSGL